MAFKKILTSDGQPIIVGSFLEKDTKFPPGFAYRVGGIIYTVKANVTQEASSPMREVTLSDGSVQIIPVESIGRDLREPDCEILPIDKRYALKVVEEVVKKKVSKKKKTSKKKVAKKKKTVVKKIAKTGNPQKWTKLS